MVNVFPSDVAGVQPAVPGTSTDPDATASTAIRKETDDTTHLQDATTASTLRDQTTLIPNESEAFALEPIDVTTLGIRLFQLSFHDAKGMERY